METEYITYEIERMDDLFDEVYNITMQKGKSRSSRFNWRAIGNIHIAIGQMVNLYKNNKNSPAGIRKLKISLEGELAKDEKIKRLMNEVEVFTNRNNRVNSV